MVMSAEPLPAPYPLNISLTLFVQFIKNNNQQHHMSYNGVSTGGCGVCQDMSEKCEVGGGLDVEGTRYLLIRASDLYLAHEELHCCSSVYGSGFMALFCLQGLQ